jgi:hypothetical protein
MSDRVLVIDENLSPRLARELRNRGRRARAVEDLGLKSALDPDLIRKVFVLFDDPILVTADDAMPAEHESALAMANATVATVKPWRRVEATIGDWEGQTHRGEEEWAQEIVHRWAHVIQQQKTGSIRRYGLNANAPWKRPRRARRAKRSGKTV